MDIVSQVILALQVVDIAAHLVDTVNQVILVLQVADTAAHLVDTVAHLVDTVPHLVDTVAHPVATADSLLDILDLLVVTLDPDIPDQFLLLDTLVLVVLRDILDPHHLQDIPHHLAVMAAEGNMELIVPLHQVVRVQLLPFTLQGLILLHYLGHKEDILHLHH